MTEEIIIGGIDVAGLSCSECPENEKKRCLEQQEKYKSEIYYLLSFLENDFTKGQIEVLKTKISYPTRCDVVLEKQLKRKEAECEELKRYEYTYLDKFLDLKQALEEIREIVKNISCFTACDEKKLEKIQTKINEVLK